MNLRRVKAAESNSEGTLAAVLANVEAQLTPLQRLDAIETRPASHYGRSANADPAQLASMTIESVGKLGATTAAQIDKTADEIMRGAEEICAKLRTLAAAIHEHSAIASEYVTDFCGRATVALEGATEVVEKFKAKPVEAGQ